MEEEFYAAIKLISGEEIVSKVSFMPEENKILVENPLQVEQAKQTRGGLSVTGFSFKEWISATYETMFVINKEHIITMTELEDEIQIFYEKTIERIAHGRGLVTKGSKLPRSSGYLGSVNEVKKSLEELFNRS